MSGINALITALLAFLKYPQKLDAHDQARLRFTQLDQDHRFMLHSQHFAYMPIEEVMKQFHATKVSVMEATRACPYAATGVHSHLSARWRGGAQSPSAHAGVPEEDPGGDGPPGRRADAEAQGVSRPAWNSYAIAATPSTRRHRRRLARRDSLLSSD